MNKITFKTDLCKGCGLCVVACPRKIIKISEETSNNKGYFVAEVADMNACTACCACATVCPDVVIEVEKL